MVWLLYIFVSIRYISFDKYVNTIFSPHPFSDTEVVSRVITINNSMGCHTQYILGPIRIY